jgi:hypothetical protein
MTSRQAPRFRSCRITLHSVEGWGPRTLLSVSAAPDGGIIVTLRAMGYPLWTFCRSAVGPLGGIFPVKEDTATTGGRLAPKLHYHRSGFTSVQSQSDRTRFGVQLKPIEEIHGEQIFSAYVELPGRFPHQTGRANDLIYQMGDFGIKSLGVSGVLYQRSRIPHLDEEFHRPDTPVSFIRGDSPTGFIDLSGFGLDSILAFVFAPLGEVIPDSPEVTLAAFQLDKLHTAGAVCVSTGGPPPRLGVLDSVPTFEDLANRRSFSVSEKLVSSPDSLAGVKPFKK